jgi:hypothetical protein
MNLTRLDNPPGKNVENKALTIKEHIPPNLIDLEICAHHFMLLRARTHKRDATPGHEEKSARREEGDLLLHQGM